MSGLIDSKKGFMYTGGFVTCIANLNIVEVMEKQFSSRKLQEFLELMDNRREADYIRELLME